MPTLNELAARTELLFQAMDALGVPPFFKPMAPGWRIYLRGNAEVDCTWILVEEVLHLQVKRRRTQLAIISPGPSGTLDPGECRDAIQTCLVQEYARQVQQDQVAREATCPPPDPGVLKYLGACTVKWGFTPSPDPMGASPDTWEAIRGYQGHQIRIHLSWAWDGPRLVLVSRVNDIQSTYLPEGQPLNLKRIEQALHQQVRRIKARVTRQVGQARNHQARRAAQDRLDRLMYEQQAQPPDRATLYDPTNQLVSLTLVVSFDMARQLLAHRTAILAAQQIDQLTDGLAPPWLKQS
jgi:hypothetical protein